MKVSVLSSGSKGNCTYVETEKHKILIDIGTSSLYIEKTLKSLDINPQDIDLVLITHSHVDHVNGLRIFCKKYNPVVYISRDIINEIKFSFEGINIKETISDIRDIKISEIPLSHDAKGIRGYTIEDNKSSMVYITDTGYISEKNFKYIKDKNLYVFESNHDVEKLMNNSKYPHSIKIRILSDKGHLSNNDSSYYLSKLIGINTKYIILAHLSEENNTEELALKTIKDTFNRKKISFSNIKVAKQNQKTELYKV